MRRLPWLALLCPLLAFLSPSVALGSGTDTTTRTFIVYPSGNLVIYQTNLDDDGGYTQVPAAGPWGFNGAEIKHDTPFAGGGYMNVHMGPGPPPNCPAGGEGMYGSDALIFQHANNGQYVCSYDHWRIPAGFVWDNPTGCTSATGIEKSTHGKYLRIKDTNNGTDIMTLQIDLVGLDVETATVPEFYLHGYDFSPDTNPVVQSWFSLDVGMQMESADGAGDGKLCFRINDSDATTYCKTGIQWTTNSDPSWVKAWGATWYPQGPWSPNGVDRDEYRIEAGPNPCWPGM